MLAGLEGGYAAADFAYNAGELVAEGYGDGIVGYGVWFLGGEGWAAEVFVEVCAADSDVGGGDLVESMLAWSKDCISREEQLRGNKWFKGLRKRRTLTWPSPHC